jgi:hypothetical protein
MIKVNFPYQYWKLLMWNEQFRDILWQLLVVKCKKTTLREKCMLESFRETCLENWYQYNFDCSWHVWIFHNVHHKMTAFKEAFIEMRKALKLLTTFSLFEILNHKTRYHVSPIEINSTEHSSNSHLKHSG